MSTFRVYSTIVSTINTKLRQDARGEEYKVTPNKPHWGNNIYFSLIGTIDYDIDDLHDIDPSCNERQRN